MAQVELNCFAITVPGTEEICAEEIRLLGLNPQIEPGGVGFAANRRDLYRVNLWSRVASRVLVRLGQFRCRDFPELYRQLLKLPWGRFVRPGRPCQVRVSCRTSRLNHSGRVAQTVRAAVEKVLGTQDPLPGAEQLILIRINNDQCTVSIDSSGELLHRRGYRVAAVEAPLRENLAAAILLKLGYDGTCPLVDPMTGSGTFAIEAALIGAGIAPGHQRHFAFMDWPHYRPHVWTLCLQESGKGRKTGGEIIALDCNPTAVAAACKNAAAAGVDSLLRIDRGQMEDLQAPAEKGLLVCNPPYGERLGRVEQMTSLYADFGRLCRESFAAWTVGWIAAERHFKDKMKIGCQRIWSFSNGGIEVELRQRAGDKREKS